LTRSLAARDSRDHPNGGLTVQRRRQAVTCPHVVALDEDVHEWPELALLVEEQVGNRERAKSFLGRRRVQLEAPASAGLRGQERREQDYCDWPTSIERIGGRLLATSTQSVPAVGET
jgi:hypothetical protein